ncbi:hypothetical protein F2Q69_00048522 [Brassica cretica]|uniref:Uncharacterized protein n=2 Tax=Brassica cretica TaxID=69181 RepID=A0ABQ7B2R2_BRACR|nr:hypothetical protein DY000_02060930 [Brassica cretica]KAF3527188.1 hypothetical protein F2Q69_00048522 [Brassica cretica]
MQTWGESRRESLMGDEQRRRPSRPLPAAKNGYNPQKRYGGFETFLKRVENRVGEMSEEGKI